MENLQKPTFKNDQYFKLNKKIVWYSLRSIENIVKKDHSGKKAFEKVWIPENQIKGSVKKIDVESFNEVNFHFMEAFQEIIENGTCLQDLELVAVRHNILTKNDSVDMHSDVDGYVVIIDIPEPEEDEQKWGPKETEESKRTFEGGNILFKKDNGEIVEITLQPDELLIAKCTNEHGVSKVLSGKRESIALFSRPKAS
jgi:hypothetical protein